MDPLTLPVAEVFGPVWQGEGPAAGQRASFLRLGLCNLACDWCDTPYTWDHSRYDVAAECPPTPPEALITALSDHGTDLLVVTGGEPMIHGRHPALASLLAQWHGAVDAETNGTIPPPRLAQRFRYVAVSPKVNTSDPVRKRLRYAVLRQWAEHPGAFLKVVCETPADVVTALDVAQRSGFAADRLWIMPEGTSAADVIATGRAVAQATADAGANLTLRQHVLLYGDARGT